MSEHDTLLHLEWIIHICLRSRHIWGTYPHWQLYQNSKKFTPGVYNKPRNMMLLGSDMFSVATAGHGYAYNNRTPDICPANLVYCPAVN